VLLQVWEILKREITIQGSIVKTLRSTRILNLYHTTRALPFLTDVSIEDRQLAERALSQQEERRRKANESRGQKADEVVEDLQRQLHDLLGAEKLGELRRAMKHERLAFGDLWQPPVDLDRD
jgi:hypothetical protein